MSEGEVQVDGAPSNDWDPLAPEAVVDPFPIYDQLRSGCPVAHSERFEGFSMLTRYKDVTNAARDHAHFRSSTRMFVHAPPADFIPLALNPPEQIKYRRRLNRYFAPERMEELEARLRAEVVDLITPLLDRDDVEFVGEFASVLPTRALCTLLNIPRSQWGEIQKLQDRQREDIVAMAINEDTRTGQDRVDSEGDDVAAALYEAIYAVVDELAELRRREPLDPERDMITGLLADDEIPDEVITGIGFLMFAAGADTTTLSLASAIHYLATHPEDQRRLRAEPELIESAAEEFLRLNPPLHHLARVVAGDDVEVDGQPLPEGSLVALNWAAANRDPEAFEDPNVCQMDRSGNRHLTFGHGVHKCVGAPLARLEMRIALQEILERTSSITLVGEAVTTPEPMASGYDRLPVEVTAA